MAPHRRTYLNDGNDLAKGALVRKQLTRKEFATRLYRLMNEKGWNQSELARQADMGRALISDYVRGTSMPEPVNLKKLADALDIEPADLLPNYDQQAIDMEMDPALEIKTSADNPNRSWLRLNREVETSTVVKIMQALEEDRATAARKSK